MKCFGNANQTGDDNFTIALSEPPFLNGHDARNGSIDTKTGKLQAHHSLRGRHLAGVRCWKQISSFKCCENSSRNRAEWC